MTHMNMSASFMQSLGDLTTWLRLGKGHGHLGKRSPSLLDSLWCQSILKIGEIAPQKIVDISVF